MPDELPLSRLAIFISGRGSNMKAIVEACRDGRVTAKPVLVLSNRYDAEGLEWAAENGIAIAAIDHRSYDDDRAGFEKEITEALDLHDVDFIALAGFMRVLTEDFTAEWDRRMINIHPSLLPKYKGLNTHKRALAAGDSEHGASVHWVTAGVDDGEVIAQSRIDIRPDDTADTLATRLLAVEHELYPQALAKALAERDQPPVE